MPQINNQIGVWLRLLTNDGTLTTTTVGTYSGANVDITLYKGWNLVGYPTAISESAQDALFGTGATWIAAYQSGTPFISDTSNLASVTMVEGEAYWVYVPNTVIWSVQQ